MPDGVFYVFASIKGLIGKIYHGQTITDADDFAGLLLEHAKVAAPIISSHFGMNMREKLHFNLPVCGKLKNGPLYLRFILVKSFSGTLKKREAHNLAESKSCSR